eukprot:CAMPEP_0172609676 /NCGR_PEP_ID=MMETSP1068-20121228/29617_1 /TAXON_ID=35684 /ORGANISM="Pseudopedinella elastica, Strain CCMP716" /LENGTH=170 /DNA_ID=CAMNT_0013413239 /DNA_START=32 /DNA_END=544 /DNA_ORIENTATION=-
MALRLLRTARALGLVGRRPFSSIEAAGPKPSITQTVVRHPIYLLDPYLTQADKDEIQSTAGANFAVIGLSGTQYKVTVDDVVVSNLIHGVDIGESLEISEVLLLGSQNETVVGRPYVSGVKVVLEVEEHTKDKKVIIFKKKRRKGYKRTKGFRRDVTLLRVKDILHENEA